MQKWLFPVLEQRCQREGFQFQAIDLRWGIPSEAGLHHRTMQICFQELQRSQEISPEPNFLVLLGDRYGWRPLPEVISQVEFDQLFQHTDSAAEQSVLEAWYRRDFNSISPTYLLRERTDSPDGLDYTKTRGADGKPVDTPDWLRMQDTLWNIINRAYPANCLRTRFLSTCSPGSEIPSIVRFQGSATEQEIWQGALLAPHAEQHVRAFFRSIVNRKEQTTNDVADFFDVLPTGRIDTAAFRSQRELKRAIRQRLGDAAIGTIPFSRLVQANGKYVIEATEDQLQQFCKLVESKLWEIIEQQIKDYWHPESSSKLKSALSPEECSLREWQIEHAEHVRLARELGDKKKFVGRGSVLGRIRDYLENDSRLPLVVHGESGCGKTAILAHAFLEIPAVDGQLIRFLGTTPRSSDLRSLLTSICQDLRNLHPIEAEFPTHMWELIEEFQTQLKNAASNKRIILFFDALDQLSDADDGRRLRWLPLTELPSGVKLVVSCVSGRDAGDPAGQPFAVLETLPAENVLSLDAMSVDEAKTLMFERWLPDAGRGFGSDDAAKDEESHQAAQYQRILERLESDAENPVAACRQPLYLALLFAEARLRRSFDAASEFGDSVPALLEQLTTRLSQEHNHGHLLVQHALGYLAAARVGLSESEMLEVLFADPDFHPHLLQTSQDNRHALPADPPRIPIALWSRLRSDLAPYLTERAAPGAHVLTAFHRQIAEWLKTRYVDDAQWKPHDRLAVFWGKQETFLDVQSDRGVSLVSPGRDRVTATNSAEIRFQRLPNRRKLTELLFEMTLARAWSLFEIELNVPLIEAAFWADYSPEHEAPFVLGDCGNEFQRDLRAAFHSVADDLEVTQEYPLARELIRHVLTFVEEHSTFFAVYPYAVRPQLSIARINSPAAEEVAVYSRLLSGSPAPTLLCRTSTHRATPGHGEAVRWMLPLNDDEFVSIAGDEPFAVWTVSPPRKLRVYHPLPAGQITAVASLKGSGNILALSADGTISYSSAGTGVRLFQAALHLGIPSCATLIDDRVALIGTECGRLVLVDLLTGSFVQVCNRIGEPLVCVSQWQNRSVLLVTPSRVLMFSLDANTMQAESASVLCAVDDQSISVAVCGKANGGRVWQLGTTDGMLIEGDESGPTGTWTACEGQQIRAICKLADGSSIVCPAYSPPVRIDSRHSSQSSTGPGTLLDTVPEEMGSSISQPVSSLVAMSDGTMAFGTADGDVIICGVEAGKTYVARSAILYVSAAIAVDDGTGLLGTRDGLVEARNLDDGQCVWSQRVGDTQVSAIAVDSRARRVACTSLSGAVTILDLATGQVLTRVDQLKGRAWLHELAYNPITSDLIVAGYPSLIYRIRGDNHEVEQIHNGRLKEGSFLRCDDSGRFMIVGCETAGHMQLADVADGGFRLKDLHVGASAAVFGGNESQILAFNAHGLVALSSNGDAAPPRPIRSAAIRHADTFRDGGHVAIVDERGTLSVIEAITARTLSAARLDGRALALSVRDSVSLVCITCVGTLYQFSFVDEVRPQ